MPHTYELINLDETPVEKHLTDLLIRHLISTCQAHYNQNMQERSWFFLPFTPTHSNF